jgi:hypothetical protein
VAALLILQRVQSRERERDDFIDPCTFAAR